jgi:hypothetical protein
MKQNETKWNQESSKKFRCNACYFSCSRESQFVRHLNTRKHQNETNMKQNETNRLVKNNDGTFLVPFDDSRKENNLNFSKHSESSNKYLTKKTLEYECEFCALSFKSRTTLWRHKNVCLKHLGNNEIVLNENDNSVIDKDMLLKIVLGNQELMKDVVEKMGSVGNNSHNNINTNSHNTNNFNIQMFLNDHCKNAMNLTDFIESLPITTETYNHTIENGLTKTITHMITDGLNNMNVLDRPIHCTDSNRKTLYIKDDDKWEKDNELNKILCGIKTIALKQRTKINKWQTSNKDWATNDNLQTQLTDLVCNSMTMIEQDTKECNKIIRAVSKNTYLTTEIKNEYK